MPIWLISSIFKPFNTLNIFVIYDLYNFSIAILSPILIFLIMSIYSINSSNIINLEFSSEHLVELFWSLLPIFILIGIGFSSLYKIYSLDNYLNYLSYETPFSEWNKFIIKVLASQWEWTYEKNWSIPIDENWHYFGYSFLKVFPQFKTYNFSYSLLDSSEPLLIHVKNLKYFGDFFQIRIVEIIFSSSDVIHSWFVPKLGIKIDCVPGQINSSTILFKKVSHVTYGGCAEVCGAFHSIIPIKVAVLINY